MTYPESNPQLPIESAAKEKMRRLHWPWFGAAFLLPAVLTFGTAAAGMKDAPVACAFVGAGLSGLVCGILLGRRLGRTTAAMVILSIVFIGLFAVASFALCFGGCMAGNYQLDMR